MSRLPADARDQGQTLVEVVVLLLISPVCLKVLNP
jgi:hypothetical protein